jgi:hypothetical protein
MPAELTLTLTVPPTATATDAQGNSYNIMLKLAAPVLAALMMLTPFALSQREPHPSIFATSTFVFQQGPGGTAIPVPIR